jgi:hypothetical protein
MGKTAENGLPVCQPSSTSFAPAGSLPSTARQHGPPAGKFLVNYDIHYDNVLAGTREPWLVVDPKPITGDLEYGMAQVVPIWLIL